jgi:5-(carboxyamino)imidazole ribonucleotide synthase
MPLERLYPLAEEGVSFIPGLDALAPLISKRGQRQLLDQFHLPCPRWFGLEQVFAPPEPSPVGLLQSQAAPGSPLWRSASPYRPPELEQRPTLPPGFRFPLMAKASRGGYDGKGTVPVADQQALEALLDHVMPSDWILEEMVPFEQELALVACRDRQGNVACWPLVQTHQHQQICDWVLLPAPVNQAVQAFARNVAASLLTGLDYVGVLAIEFFYGPGGLQVNEIAPRTHNSGHVTIEACRCSQFAQQVRIVAGLPMGSTDSRVPGALMVNLLGLEQELSEQEQHERLAALAALPGAHLHWYGKAQAAPGRKLGHLTLVLAGSSSADRQGERDRLLAEVRRIWPLPEAIEPPKNPLE